MLSAGMCVSETGEIRLVNMDRMPIHHKLLEKKKIQRKIASPREGRPLIRSRTFTKLKRGASRAEIQTEIQRPTTPKYLKENYDFDKSSSSEESVSDDDKEKKQTKPLDMSQKIYLAACERNGIPPRKRLVKGLAESTLDVRNFLLIPEDIKALSTALTSNMCVSSINLYGNKIGREGVEYLVEMLEDNTTITELNLSNTQIGLYEISLLTELLSENLTITSFEAAGNNLDDDCAKCFAEALKFNRKLKKLNLSNNSFQENGGKILAKSIETNDSITDLDMSWNHIRLFGAVAWGDALYKYVERLPAPCGRRNEELRYLNLSWNGFGDEGGAAIGEALEENKTLLKLDLSNNRIGLDGCKGLSRGLSLNTSLQFFSLSKNPLTTQGTTLLLNSINDNGESKLRTLLLVGIQVTQDTDGIVEEIVEQFEDFKLLHGGYVISPDILTIKPKEPEEKKCKSSKS